MIASIEIAGLRGITKGLVDGLGPLTVLVGPSGAGKSTVLDALLIAASPSPGDAIGRVIKRRAELRGGAAWLFANGRNEAEATVRLPSLGRGVVIKRSEPEPDLVALLESRSVSPVGLRAEVASRFGVLVANVVVDVDNEYRFDLRWPNRGVLELFQAELDTQLIEPSAGANHAPLHRVYSEATRGGGLRYAVELLREVIDGLVDLRVLTFEDKAGDTPILHLDFGTHTVPVAGAGSGVYALVRLALELAAVRSGLALIEEPEVHQHPRSLHQSAKVLHAAAARGIQVVLSTHSLDLIDSLVASADGEAGLERLRVVRIARTKDGELRCSTYAGREVAEARNAVGEDLR